MTISDVSRFAAPSGRAARRLLVTLLAVGALLLGILMMHSVANSHEGADAGGYDSGSQLLSAETAPMAAASALEHGSTVTSIGCSGPCDDTHDSGIMACILALLTAGVLLIGYALGQWRTPPRDLLRRLLPRAGTFSLRLAPTLEALSISRT